MMRAGLHTSLLPGILLLAGCYSYKPIASPSAGMEVRARLTAEAAVRRSQGLEEPVLRLDGKIVEATNEAIRLDMLVARSSSAFQDVEMRDTISVARNEV